MPTLFTTIRAAATSLDALQKSTAASQNNVTNATTPGYARQKIRLEALDFQSTGGLAGGVKASRFISTRDEFAEQAVRTQMTSLASAQEMATQTAWLENNFSLDDILGVTSKLNKLYAQFSSWSVAPQSLAERENVVSAATEVARAFNRTADALKESGQNADRRIQTTLDAINAIAERIREINIGIRNGGGQNAGLDARLHSELEELSGYVGIQVIFQSDGAATVLIGRETPLVIGDQSYHFSVAPDPAPPLIPGATPKVVILDREGTDVTATMNEGRMGALLEFRNETVPSFVGGPEGIGDLNRLARTFAERVNGLLTDGDTNAVPLFSWQSDIAAAASLKVTGDASTLSAADPTASPAAANGRALKLAALAHPSQPADQLDGLSYVSFFGQIAARAGRLAADSTAALSERQDLLTQARGLREQISGVSLDEEALDLMQAQRAYQASSRIIAILDQITQMAVNTGRN